MVKNIAVGGWTDFDTMCGTQEAGGIALMFGDRREVILCGAVYSALTMRYGFSRPKAYTSVLLVTGDRDLQDHAVVGDRGQQYPIINRSKTSILMSMPLG